MASLQIEVSVSGRRLRVPAVAVNGRHIVAKGKWIKTASVQDEDWLEGALESPWVYVDRLKNAGASELDASIFSFAQRVPDTTPRYSFPMEWESIATIRLDDPKAWWEKLPQETRKNVRRAAKRGVVVSLTTLNDDVIRGIVDINNESPIRQGKPFVHYGKDAKAVRDDYSSFADRTEFVCAYSQDELIGFIQLVYMGRLVTMLEILTKESHYDKRPANALIAKAVEHCASKGMSHLTYGRYTYGNKGTNNPLTEFKRRNGFEEFRVPRYYVPLNALGRLCIACKLHRGLLGLLPESVILSLLALRRTWYRSSVVRKPV